jgi:hypothetical protein
MTNELIYTITGESSRGQVSSYHHKPNPLFLNKSKFKNDIAGLKKADLRTAIVFDGSEYSSKFTIGYEVEKNQLSRNAVKEYPLFCGFERDGSCGYEAVTHILPLLPAGKWRTKVFNLFHQAEKIIDDRFSPSDRRCGGHITIAVDGLSGDEVREKVRQNCGIILSLFKKRLSNSFCNHNRTLLSGEAPYDSYRGGWHSKYQVALVKGDCLEFRIPSRFQSVKQAMRRYELFYELLNFSINKPNGSHDAFLKVIKPIILSMYNGNEDETNEVLRLAKLFREYIVNNTIHPDIAQYV